jgi:hypothetical protein
VLKGEIMLTSTKNVTSSIIPSVERPSFKAYRILQVGFTAAPIIAGLDKFFDFLVNWTIYLSPIVSNMINAQSFMKIVGVVEIAAGIIVFVKPKIGAFIVAFWLWAIILNLLTIPAYYDIALRDFGLSLGALALGFLAKEYNPA